jgi:hypothetical protein
MVAWLAAGFFADGLGFLSAPDHWREAALE